MSCGCGGAKVEALTTNQAQELIDAARAAAQSETDAMIASAAQAVQNANSGASAQR